jgi:SAM-dependent methyltransferase
MTNGSTSLARFCPVETLLSASGWPDVSREVSPRDEMYRAALSAADGDPALARFQYFKTGIEIARAQSQVLDWFFAKDAGRISILDFASGFGRVTRFLARGRDRRALWVADLQHEGVDFQVGAFQVHGIYSAAAPQDLQSERRFDAVFATSLFTHLPESLFGAWLQRLLDFVAPGGLLLFSTLDESLAGDSNAAAASGITFQSHSESTVLSPDLYGTTWVAETFVRGLLEDLVPTGSVRRLARAVCNHQDLWIVTPGHTGDLAHLDFQGEPELGLNEVSVAHGRLALAGWVVRRHGRRIRHLRVTLQGAELGVLPVSKERPDVAAFFGARHLVAGWDLAVEIPDWLDDTAEAPLGRFLLLEALTENGERTVVWGGPLYRAALAFHENQSRWFIATVQDLRAQAEVERLARDAQLADVQAKIGWMRASRFWKLREIWWRIRSGRPARLEEQ